MVCTSLEAAHAAVVQLVNDFAASEAHYLSPGYSEAQARISFIDKLWAALGWDVNHEHQKNPYAQEVKVEDPQKILGSQRRADYAFHTAPNYRDARFFCEAKKPNVQLKTDANAAFQTVRYGYSAGTKLAVLTDFEQFLILDCRAPADVETALARTHRYFHYKDWLDPQKFAELYYLFSREAFRDGGFDAYVAKLPRPKKVGKQLGLLRAGTLPADAAFLNDLEAYRETLAKLLKAADHTLDGDALTELVQRILDRLVFLRFLEDKLIETEHQVHHLSRAAGGHSWAKFLAVSRKLDARYNGIVFKHHPILDAPGRLPVDDARFADLCEELSHTKSPYDFNYIPIHILGSIYERFLGKVIVTTDQRARVEEKPEVRKAGGVYYTPEYIVRYICEQTVGRLIEGKTPAQIAKLRFADIACGSGSFLLGVYDLLLRAHGLWYNAHPAEALKENIAPAAKGAKRKKEFIPAVTARDGVLRLTLEKKREILLNNVFGVDLDPQAVEVAQLSLYLKLLEDETTASAHQHYLNFHEALLPSLTNNIQNFNSLIGDDIDRDQFAFGDSEERKLKPMDFQSAFPQIFSGNWSSTSSRVAETPHGDFIEVGPGEPTRDMPHFALKSGEPMGKPKPKRKIESEDDPRGFDAIVGNPPYVRIQTLQETSPISVAYLSKHYVSAKKGNYDLYVCFVERALRLLNAQGRMGFILPHKFFNAQYGAGLRQTLADGENVERIVHFGHEQVFEGATTYTCLLFLTKAPAGVIELLRIDSLEEWFDLLAGKETEWVPAQSSMSSKVLQQPEWNLMGREEAALLEKLQADKPTLEDVTTRIFQGIKTSADKIYIVEERERIDGKVRVWSPEKEAEYWLEPDLLHPLIKGGDSRRYILTRTQRLILFPYAKAAGAVSLISSGTMAEKFPLTWAYLNDNKPYLSNRESGKMRGPSWYAFGRSQALDVMPLPKIFTPDLAARAAYSYDTSGEVFFTGGVAGGYGILAKEGIDPRYLLALLNSRVLEWIIAQTSTQMRGGYFSFEARFIRSLPIVLPTPVQMEKQDLILRVVDRIASTHETLAADLTTVDRTYYENSIKGFERKIDELTCDLYGLTPEERALVAGA